MQDLGVSGLIIGPWPWSSSKNPPWFMRRGRGRTKSMARAGPPLSMSPKRLRVPARCSLGKLIICEDRQAARSQPPRKRQRRRGHRGQARPNRSSCHGALSGRFLPAPPASRRREPGYGCASQFCIPQSTIARSLPLPMKALVGVAFGVCP